MGVGRVNGRVLPHGGNKQERSFSYCKDFLIITLHDSTQC